MPNVSRPLSSGGLRQGGGKKEHVHRESHEKGGLSRCVKPFFNALSNENDLA